LLTVGIPSEVAQGRIAARFRPGHYVTLEHKVVGEIYARVYTILSRTSFITYVKSEDVARLPERSRKTFFVVSGLIIINKIKKRCHESRNQLRNAQRK